MDILNLTWRRTRTVAVGCGWLSADGHEGYDPAGADC